MRSDLSHKARTLGPHAGSFAASQSSQSPENEFYPTSRGQSQFGGDHQGSELRTYTEEQVAQILQISRSQLRKWRMGWSRGQCEGPPFKKIGRIIRYPESGLRAFIYGP